MSTIDTNQVIVPSSPDVQRQIREAVKEADAAYTRIAGEQDFLKELFADLAKETELPKAYLVKVAKAFHKQNYAKLTADQENFAELYEKLFGNEDNGGSDE